MSVDPVTMQQILQTIPEVNKRRRQAAMLRGAENTFNQMGQTKRQNYVPAQQGAWFPTVQKYIKDYGAAADGVAGAIGGYLSGRQASGVEEELANMVGGQSVQAAHQIGGGGDKPTAQALRAYLGAIGGKDATALVGNTPRVQRGQIDKDGRVWNVMSDGSKIDTGMIADYKTNTIKTADGRVIGVGTSGAGRNVAEQVQEITGVPMEEVSVEGQDPIRVESSMPDNQVAALIRQHMGLPENAPIPDYTTAPAPSVRSSTPLRVPTAAEEAAATAAGKAQGEAANAPLIAATQGAIDLAKGQAKNTAEAQAGLGAVESTTNAGIEAIDRLINHEGLDDIVGGGLWGRLPDKIVELGLPVFQAGTPAAGALAEYKHLMGANFLQAFQQLKGGGQITEIEGAKAEQALARLSRAQKKEDVQSALRNLQAIMTEIRDNARKKAAGGVPSAAPAAPSRPALPAGFEWGD